MQSALGVVTGWFARALVAAAVVSSLDVAFTAASVPALHVLSGGAVVLFVDGVALLLPVGLAFAALGDAIERTRWAPSIPDPATVVTLLVGALATAWMVTALGGVAVEQGVEFPARIRWLQLLVSAGVSFGTFAVSFGVLLPALRRVFGARPAAPRRVLGVLAWGAALVGVGTSHRGLFAVHLNALAAWVGVLSVGAAWLGARLSVPDTPKTRRVGGGLAGAALVIALFPASHDQARFMLFNHSPIAGRVAMTLRDVADRDGDGTVATWLGGTDCDDGNADIGPVIREIPGDGVDQDCRGGDAVAFDAPARPPLDGCVIERGKASVLLITVDAMRWDIFVQGFAPNLTAFAKDSTVFVRAYSPGAHTKSSVASMLFARALSDVHGSNVLDTRVSKGTTLAERFVEAGYKTAGFQPFELDPATQAGFLQYNSASFDVSVRVKGDPRSAQTTNAVLEVMRTPAAWPLFVWAHYPDAHAPYPLAPPVGEGGASAEEAAYLQSIAYVDREVGRLLGTMAAEGLLERTVVAVSADHGEDLDWRGREGHGANLYEESVHVPLLLKIPGCAPRTVESPVSVAWVGATLGAAVGVEVPGESLSSGLEFAVTETDYENEHRRAVVSRTAKLIVDVRNGGRVLFDLTADSEENNDVLGARPELAAELDGAYQRWLDRPGAR